MRKFIVPALAAFSLAVIATPAAAEESSVVVHYDDLNLLSPAGVAQLESRIVRAVNRVCSESERRNLALWRFWNECRKQARQEANVQVARAIERERTLALDSMLSNNPRG